MLRRTMSRVLQYAVDPWSRVTRRTRVVRSLDLLGRAMSWSRRPILDGEYLDDHDDDLDLNDRRRRDAEVIGAACANGDPKIVLEIGTARGQTTALMAANAPAATVYTVNIPPEEIAAGGRHVSCAMSRDEIGSYYRARKLDNVRQILANTASWEPDFGPIDVAFIDGCHDASFVFHDTRKVLSRCRPGSTILWHDFDPVLARDHDWMGEVCRGIERLYVRGLIGGRILHLQDSWVGLYRVRAEDVPRPPA